MTSRDIAHDIAIVGAGFSGTMVAVNLARRSRGGIRIALIERGREPGRGVAYGTTDPHHLLNVRADRMGAFTDDPGDFFAWLRRHGPLLRAAGVDDATGDSFIPRLVYGEYLQDILRRTRAEFPVIDLIRADVTDLAPMDTGYHLRGETGTVTRAGSVVLALGNFPPGECATGRVMNPYAPETLDRLARAGDVFLVGTGLTTLDLLATVEKGAGKGQIHVLSRKGLFPQKHGPVQPYPPFIDPEHPPATALGLLAVVRREVRQARERGIGWQSVIDSLRPYNQKFWQAMPFGERRKFLRHVRAHWDSHRHRAAPEVVAARDRLEAAGRLIRHRGAFLSMKDTANGVTVTWMPAGETTPETTLVDFAVSCTGPQADCRKLDDPLVKSLLQQGLLAPDLHFIGADTAEDGSLRNREGQIVPGLYTLGQWHRGRLGESVAVPELREQAEALAATLLSRREPPHDGTVCAIPRSSPHQ